MNRKLLHSIFLVPLLFLLLWSCNDTETSDPVTVDLGDEYINIDTGTYKEYEIDLMNIALSTTLDTTYYLKEVIASKTVQSSETEFTLHRFYKPTLAATYNTIHDTTWKSVISTSSYVNIENNIRFVRLDFPLSLNRTWDGNAQNNLSTDNGGLQIYRVDSIDQFYAVSDTVSFAKTITIIQNNKKTLLDTNIVYEVYAENVGLIERFSRRAKYDGSLTLTSLTQFHQKLIRRSEE